MLYNDNSQSSKNTALSVFLLFLEIFCLIGMGGASYKYLLVGSTVNNHYEITVDDRDEYKTETKNNCWILCRPGSENSEDNRKEVAE